SVVRRCSANRRIAYRPAGSLPWTHPVSSSVARAVDDGAGLPMRSSRIGRPCTDVPSVSTATRGEVSQVAMRLASCSRLVHISDPHARAPHGYPDVHGTRPDGHPVG